MDSPAKKYVVTGGVVVIIVACMAVAAIQFSSRQAVKPLKESVTNSQQAPDQEAINNSIAPESVTESAINTVSAPVPIDTRVGSVAGVDLSTLASEANDSAMAATGDDNAIGVSTITQPIDSKVIQ